MSLTNRIRLRRPAMDEELLSFRAEVESAVEVMVAHRIKPAVTAIYDAVADVRASKLSTHDTQLVVDTLLDARNKLAGAAGVNQGDVA